MLEMWNLLKGAGSEDEDKVKLVNIKRFFCALEGIPTSKLLRKTIQYDTETLWDEANNFYVNEKTVKRIFKLFRPIIQNKVAN